MKAKVRHLAADPVVSARHSPKRISHILRQSLSLGLAAVLVFLLSGTAFAYQQLNDNIKKVSTDDLMDVNARPTRDGAAPMPGDPFTGRALNIVLIGSDSRAGDNTKIAKFVDGMRSDTTILAHISQDRSRVDLVSFPRDMMLNVAPCKRSDGTSTGADFMQFNAAFSYGGQNGDVASAAACTMTAVEGLTNVRLDGFIVVDMEGFANVIEAIGGVDLCIPQDIDSPKARLKIKAGLRHLDGLTALKYARARTGTGLGGDGSDLSRIERQQKLLGAVSREILSSAVLTSPQKLYGTLNSITQSLTMTKDFANVPALAGLGLSLKDLDKDNISFITVPVGAYAPDPNRVIPLMTKAEPLFKALKKDKPIEGTHAWDVANGGASAAASPDGAQDGESGPSSSPSATSKSKSGSKAVESTNPFDAKSASSDPDICKRAKD